MSSERKKTGFELLLSNFTSNIGRMIIVNLIFALPLLLSAGLAYFVCTFVDLVPIILPLALVFASPFYAGVVVLCREYSQGKHVENIFKTYVNAVKENWLKFLASGVILYLAFVGCYFSIVIYSRMTQVHWFFYALLFVAILVAVFFLFFFYAVFLMTASFDLKLKDIYKNSALMTFGEVKNNFLLTVCCLALLAMLLFPVIVIFYLSSVISASLVEILLIVYLAFAFGVLIPAPCTLVTCYFLYPNMMAIIAGDDISDGNDLAAAPDIRDVHQNTVPEDTSNIDTEALLKGDDEEYIFYKGKMIKRKVLKQMLEEKEYSDNE